MATPIDSTKAAALIVEQTGRRCSRQNLEKVCRTGAMQGSPAILHAGPFRFDADMIVSEYMARTDVRQTACHQPATPRRQPSCLPDPDADGIPNYNEERARREREVRIMAQMDRRQREGELLERSEVERAWAQSVTIAKTALMGVPSRAKERIPHLDLNEIEVLTELIRGALEEVANAGRD
jgi:hypothetical protein